MPDPLTQSRAVQTSLLPDLAPDRRLGRIVGSVQTGSNADLIAAIAPLYLTGSVLDTTYGKGKWWTTYRPTNLTAHDLHTLDGVNFTALPEASDTYDTVCFDPPYTLTGTPSATRLGPTFQHRYGITDGDRGTTGALALDHLLRAGLTEAIRVTRQWVLVKCMEFSEGPHVPPWRQFHDIPHMMTTHAMDHGCVKHDQIVHWTGVGPGPRIAHPRRARRHHSYLLVFRKIT